MYCHSNTRLRFRANRIPQNTAYYTHTQTKTEAKEKGGKCCKLPQLFLHKKKQLQQWWTCHRWKLYSWWNVANNGINYAYYTAYREIAVCRGMSCERLDITTKSRSHLGMKSTAWVIRLKHQSISKLEYGSWPTWADLEIYIKILQQKRRIQLLEE